MGKRDLSVLIPARNEMFLQRTVDDVLKHKRANTEVIVVLDGYWPDVGLKKHDDVTVIHYPESIGQRGATNKAAAVSSAEYVMKLDAHCAVGPGFDVKLIEAAKATGEHKLLQIPRQYNLHAFNWRCPKCGWEKYQGRTPEECGNEECDATSGFERAMKWRPRKSKLTTSWRFNSEELHFDYWGAFKQDPRGQPDQYGLSETMSLLGACWFLRRDRFWEIDGLDEAHGGWGQMGTELACKTWLSEGRVVCNHNTWFAHMFRTQGGDFGFPYPLKKNQTNRTRAYSNDLWRNGKWPKATRPLSWLIEYFDPPGKWDDVLQSEGGGDNELGTPSDVTPPAPTAGAGVTKGIVYYSDCRGDEEILNKARAQLGRSVNGHEIVSSCLGYVPFGTTRIEHPYLERGYLAMFRQILAGLELSLADVVFICEHDVLYPPDHFRFTPPSRDVIYYNENVWKVDAETGRALHYRCKQTSGLCAYRETLLKHYRKRVALVEERGFTRKMGFEPGTHRRAERVDDLKAEAWWSERPLVDIRHGKNLTESRWRQDQFRNKDSCRGWTEADEVPGWGRTKGRFREFLREVR